MGKTDWNTACSPLSSRSLGSLSICRKRSYERFCTSIRFGIWMVAGILEKSKRLRKAFFIVKKLPISRAAEGRAQTAECGAQSSYDENRAAGSTTVQN